MNHIAELLAEVRHSRIEVTREGLEIVLRSSVNLSEDLRLRLTEHKSDVLLYLRHGTDWAPFRQLSSHLGEWVTYRGKQAILWGVSPHGAMIDLGACVLVVSPDDVQLGLGP